MSEYEALSLATISGFTPPSRFNKSAQDVQGVAWRGGDHHLPDPEVLAAPSSLKTFHQGSPAPCGTGGLPYGHARAPTAAIRGGTPCHRPAIPSMLPPVTWVLRSC
ncbi:hypothetical protein GCM10010214_17120 [Streptomyces abikoensis]|nr:hypothetical protein GCM10010214_17120 [Streptomyces abikoensis]